MLNAHQNEFQAISSQILFPKFCWQALRSGSFQCHLPIEERLNLTCLVDRYCIS